MTVTRQVISDLWPLYAAGEASDDTRALVEAFIASDPEFGRTLKAPLALPAADAPAPATAEVAALQRTRDLVLGRSWMRALRLMAVAFTALALRRALTEVEWTTSPAMFVGEAIAAAVLWTTYALLVRHYRAQALRTARR
jgi:hypothetical protein